MSFVVLIPARLGSTRLPDKPLADLHGEPMVVRVARRAAMSTARQVVVAADHASIVDACGAHGVAAVLTSRDHATGSDRLAEASRLLGLSGDEIVVNVQGDEPLIDPALVDACARTLADHPDCVMSTAAHEIAHAAEFANPNVVKVITDRRGLAITFSRAPIPFWRDAGGVPPDPLPAPRPLRHIGLYAYRADFLQRYPGLARSPLETIEALEQLRVLWHGHRVAVHVTDQAPGPGVDTPEDLDRVRSILRSRG